MPPYTNSRTSPPSPAGNTDPKNNVPRIFTKKSLWVPLCPCLTYNPSYSCHDAIWFISHVSVIGLRDAQGANKAQLRVCLWWCFQERLAFELVSKAGGPSQHGWASASPLRDYPEHNGRGRADLLSDGLGTSSSSALGHGCSWFSGLWTQTELCTSFSDSLVFR